jgi:hypothetical protein
VEVSEVPCAWYLDAWAVRDGVAFASVRPPDSIDARNTVFLSVPELQPTPVGRITTALAATRRGFQAGLRDFGGVEVAFDNLSQVREVVRRGYLAGGLGPGGAATPAFPLPPGRPGDGGGTYFANALGGSPWAETRWYEPGDRDFRMLRQQVPLTELAGLVQCFAEATALQWELILQHQELPTRADRRDPRWGLREWYLTLIAHRIWENIDEFARFVVRPECRIGRQLWERTDHRSCSTIYSSGFLAPEQRQFSDQALLQSAPCPLLHHWNPHIRRLMDKLLLALSDAQYFAHNNQVPELIPILLAARLSASAPPLVHSAFDDGLSSEEMMDHALGWLVAQTPRIELPEIAETLLSQYAQKQLEVPQPRGQDEFVSHVGEGDRRHPDHGHDK